MRHFSDYKIILSTPGYFYTALADAGFLGSRTSCVGPLDGQDCGCQPHAGYHTDVSLVALTAGLDRAGPDLPSNAGEGGAALGSPLWERPT